MGGVRARTTANVTACRKLRKGLRNGFAKMPVRPAEELMSRSSPFGNADFRTLLIGQTTSQLGAQLSAVAMPLLAVLTLDASPFEVGLLTASSTLGFVVIGLPAGAWLDRMRCRPVLITADLCRAGLLASIPAAAFLGALTMLQLVVVALLSGIARVFFDIGYQSYIPTVTGKDGVLAGNSSMETVRAAGKFAGPGLGGWLVGLLGAANVLLIQTVTFLASAVSLSAIKVRETTPSEPPRPTTLRVQIKQGLTFVLRNKVLRTVALSSAVCNLSFAVSSAVTFIFMARSLQMSPTVIGLVVAAGSVTSMLGASLTPRLSRTVGSARIVWAALAVTAPVTLLIPCAQPGWTGVVFLVAGMGANELGQIVYAIANLSLRQRLCPAHLMARVNATMRFFITGAAVVGGLLGGVLGETVGLRGTLWIAVSLVLPTPVPLFLALRSRRTVEDLGSWHAEPVAEGAVRS